MNETANDTNPLLQTEGLPMFRRITAAHVEPAVKNALERARKLLAESEREVEPTWDRTIGALDLISDIIERVWTPVGHLMGVRNSPELRAAYEAAEPDVVAFGLEVAQSEPFYRALVALKDAPGFAAEPEVRQRIVEARIRDAELGGIGLAGTERARFNEIVAELSALQTRFSNNVLDATRAFSLDLTTPEEAAGLPESLRNLTAQAWSAAHPEASPATPEAGPWRITLDPPVIRPFLDYADRRDLREKVWRAFNRRANSEPWDNTGLIDRILLLRREMAKLLGYSTFAELSLASKMADVAGVDAMHARLLEAAWTRGNEELEELRTFARSRGESEPLQHWDLPYWRRALRDERFRFSYEELKPYFSMPRVLDGLFALIERIFHVRIVASDGEAQTWNDDVRFFSVLNDAGERIAAFFLDPYSRPAEKRGGAWMSECQQRWFDEADGKRRIPVAHLICNGTPPVGDKPSLMGFDEVETLFHEFGHGLQHMLTTVDQPGAAGIANVEWDAVELPSQFMENWCYDRSTVMEMARHYESGEQLPDDLFEKLNSARTYAAASFLLRQLLLGMVDIELHHRYDPGGQRTATDSFQAIARRTSPLPPDPNDATLCSFSHIFAGGYAAGYYSYKWAEVLSADAFEAFEEAGLENPTAIAEVGRRFRDTVLALGGSRDPMRVFEDFRGRPPEPDALLRSYGLLPSAA